MTPETQTALKTIVERAVRPVRATFERKRRMREELLAHVTEVFAGEVAKSGDEAAAVAATERRFGDADAVAEGLAKSVLRVERCTAIFERITLARPDEGAVRRALRWGLFVLVVMMLFDGPAFLLTHLLTGEGSDFSFACAAFFSLVIASSVATFEFVLLGAWLRQVLLKNSGRRSIIGSVLVVLSSIILPGTTVFAACVAVTGDVAWSTAFLSRAALVIPVCLAIVFLVARKFDAERSEIDRWASLQLH